jgi:hypothetical protein
MQEPISRRAVLKLAGAGAALAASVLLGACRNDGNDGGSGGSDNEGGMGSGNRGRRRN